MIASARLNPEQERRFKRVLASMKRHPKTMHRMGKTPDIVREAMALWAEAQIEELGLNDDGSWPDPSEEL